MGEGRRDVEFLRALCLARGIIGYTFDEVEGNDKFGSYLSALSAQPSYTEHKSILLVSDNDASAGKSFAKIKDQLNKAGFPSPPRPLEIANKKDYPALAVLMMPYPDVAGSSDGCLETLLIPAMESANAKEAACVDGLMACIQAQNWPKKGSRDKLKVRCLISSVWKDDPMHGLPYCFTPSKGLIPLNHQIFDGVSELLSNFQAWSVSTHKTWADWKQANP